MNIKISTMTSLLDIFDRYNFTVNEEEPFEKEVALDPELLGKIYEKLNAIRPDNFDEYVKVIKSGKKREETKFNKEYGVYSTPREIVHYMCQESLISYLETELKGKVSREDLIKFVKIADSIQENEVIALEREDKIKSGEQKTTRYESQVSENIKNNAEEIDKLLADIKVCDPAVGSGAFPVGMMHEIVKLRQLLSVFLKRETKSYDFKRHCIENSLYGVDIDPGAVEICKLRFWLSLIVDEEDFYNIKPLPKLDYKAVCGDSLLGFPENWGSPIEKDIESLMEQYFNETNPSKKQELKNKIDDKIRFRFEQSERNFGYKINFDFKLFFPKVFREKGGFDVVIANPPYIKEYINRKTFDKIRGHPYYQGKMDIWYFFACKGIDLLRENGVLTFIAQNNWVTSYVASKMRDKVIKDLVILQLVDFGAYFVFENSDIQTMIMIFKKDHKSDHYSCDVRRLIKKDVNFKDVIKILSRSKGDGIEYLTPIIRRRDFIGGKQIVFSDSNIEKILQKIESNATFRLEAKEISQGIIAPQDFLSHINTKKNLKINFRLIQVYL